MNVGQRIRQRREELGLSQGDLAKRMNVTRQAISKAEKLGESLTTITLTKYAKALNCTEAHLLGWEEEKKNNDTISDIIILLRKDQELLNMVAKLSKLDNPGRFVVGQTLDALFKQLQDKVD